ncbi:MAG: potassium transporter TrkG [Pseudomonadota bacterium]
MLKGAQSSLLFWTLLVVIIAMSVPMIAAAIVEDWLIARTFMYYGLFSAIILYIYGIALGASATDRSSGAALLEAASVYVAVPLVAAAPVAELYPGLGWRLAIFEMISAFTTTGASRMAFIEPVSDVIHLWRGIVAWLGGYYFLLIAFSILGPLRINGCDIRADGNFYAGLYGNQAAYDASRRTVLRQFNKRVLPAYLTISSVLFLLLMITGEDTQTAAIMAMSTLSTSGIVLENYTAPFASELLVFIFLFVAVSRFTLSFDDKLKTFRSSFQNPEFRLAVVLIASVTTFLFLRHYIAILGEGSDDSFIGALQAVWGALFTTLSFLTTAGFVSEYWSTTQTWSELATSELILMALVICGGGVATTAGGVKLLRVYSLAKHGRRELDRLMLPNMTHPSGGDRQMRRRSVVNAWVVVMLFVFSIGLFTLIFTLFGFQLADALLISVSGLSTTGPLISEAVTGKDLLSEFGDLELVFFEIAMIVGRLETLAVVALFNPILWQSRLGGRKQKLA